MHNTIMMNEAMNLQAANTERLADVATTFESLVSAGGTLGLIAMIVVLSIAGLNQLCR